MKSSGDEMAVTLTTNCEYCGAEAEATIKSIGKGGRIHCFSCGRELKEGAV